MAKSISSRTVILAALAVIPGLAQSTPAPVGQEAQKAQLDSIDLGLDAVEAQARRSLFGGGSKPVSFSGEALLRFIGTSYDKYPGWMEKDQTETKNSFASVRVGMVAAPHRTLRLWSKMAFNAALMGYSKPGTGSTTGQGWTSTPQTGYFDPHSNIVYEDMAAGLVAKTGPITTSTKIGGTLWEEASPLTVWKGQNRMFGWDYVPYELEQSEAQYWEYATLKGEKTGRAAWNKKPFQGLMMESVEMPDNWAYSLVLGEYEGFQKWRENVINPNNTNGLMYTNDATGARTYFTKGLGLGDSYRRTFVGRLSKAELPGAVTAGINYTNLIMDNDYAKQWLWASNWGGLSGADAASVQSWYRRINTVNGVPDTVEKYRSNYFTSYQTVSLDARRNLPGGFQFHIDLGASLTDTSFFKIETAGGPVALKRYRAGLDSARITNADQYEVVGHGKSSWVPAVYATASYPVALGGKNYDFQLASIYAPKQFYSGSSFIIPADIFFPFEANLMGAGKFASSDGGSPYVSNMTGANFMAKLPVPNGHARVTAGFHKQIENGSDLIFLPWRLNGTAFKYSQNASTTQYDGVGLVDDYLRGNAPFGANNATGSGSSLSGRFKQVHRFADDFFAVGNPDGTGRRNAYGPVPGLAGGIRSDFMATYEGFGAFKMSKDTAQRKLDSSAIAQMMIAGLMPQSTKNTQNLSFDAAYDIARLWGGKNSLFLGAYGALNSVTKNGTPIPSMAKDDKTLLSGTMLRFEAVAQLSSKFYLIGVVGRETWVSSYGVAPIDSITGNTTTDAGLADPRNWHSAPIDYTDLKIGAGFDWDMASRVGLHVRLERFMHTDDGISEEVTAAKGKNDFKAWLLHAETKMWF